ncbi:MULTISPECIES: DEAD/DEAH box helicase [unclassified Stygiolobus]|uniref:DEAD/DEAH box helicase n=1 Tax=unclassified Stygiolobus TaxID=2824672 RepID=UPI00307EDF4E
MFSEEVDKALKEMGFSELTEVQRKTIPLMLSGKNVIVRAKTGSGKTAAFGIPIVELGYKSLVITPTRELTRQVSSHIKSIGKYKGIKVAEIYGGMPYNRQLRELEGADVVVATPGRLLDLWGKGEINLEEFEVVVVDEADLMLDMGFIEDVEMILSHTTSRKITGLFSATIPKEIEALASKFVDNPERVYVCEGLANVEHKFLEVEDDWRSKVRSLREEEDSGIIVFMRTRSRVAKLVHLLDNAVELRGDLPQRVRNENIDAFRRGEYDILVTTDVASRGIDIPLVHKVINFDAPQDLKTYIHRIGRTGRMGKKGVAITFLTPRDFWLEREVKKLLTKETKVGV